MWRLEYTTASDVLSVLDAEKRTRGLLQARALRRAPPDFPSPCPFSHAASQCTPVFLRRRSSPTKSTSSMIPPPQPSPAGWGHLPVL